MEKNSLRQTDTPWFVPGKWNVSPYNWAEDVREEMPNLPRKVDIRDVTLREGEDQMGFYMTTEQKVEFALRVAEIGMPEIEIGGPSIKPHQAESCKAIRKAYDEFGIKTDILGRYFGDAKDHKHEIDLIMKAGATVVRCTVIDGVLWEDKEMWEKELNKLPEAVEYIHKEYGAEFSTGIDDCTRAKIERVRNVYKFIKEIGPDKVWFADTHSAAIPSTVRYLASEIKKIIGDLPLECHMHNQAGLAVANTLAAIEGGASRPDCVWNGYGDGAGNACLEEVALDLETLYGVKTGLQLDKIYGVSNWLEKTCGIQLQPHKAYTGKNAFVDSEYSSTHPDTNPIGLLLLGVPKEEIPARMAAQKDLLSRQEVFNPEVLGKKKDGVWGPIETRQEKVIKAKLELMGLKHSDKDVDQVIKALDKAVNKENLIKRKKGYLITEEFEELVRKTIVP